VGKGRIRDKSTSESLGLQETPTTIPTSDISGNGRTSLSERAVQGTRVHQYRWGDDTERRLRVSACSRTVSGPQRVGRLSQLNSRYEFPVKVTTNAGPYSVLLDPLHWVFEHWEML